MKTITLVDTNSHRYTIQESTNVLGRRYDNNSEYLKIEIPDSEKNHICTMIVTNGTQIVDHINVTEEPVKITTNLSQYANVQIGFSFSGDKDYIKNSEIKTFYFLSAQKPDGFVPMPPEQSGNIDKLMSMAFVDVMWDDKSYNTLQFVNLYGNIVKSIDLKGFIQEQADLSETDKTSETFVKGKKTSNLLNDGDGTSNFATLNDVDKKIDNLDYIKTISINGTKVDANNKNVDISVPTNTSQLKNDSDFVTKSDISDVYKAKGSVQTYADLPSDGNEVGDVWNVIEAYAEYGAGTNFVWTSTGIWDALGGLIDIDNILVSKNINDVVNENWTFILDDGSTITKVIKVGS